MSASLLDEIDLYKYLTGEKVLVPQKHRIIGKPKSISSPLIKVLQRQTNKKKYSRTRTNARKTN